MSCIVIYGDSGSIIGTQTPKEEVSKLFPEVLNKVKNPKRAADLVALTYTERFKEQVTTPLKSKYKSFIRKSLDNLEPSDRVISLLHKGKEYPVDLKNLQYKTVEVNGFTTFQAFTKAGEEFVMLGKVRMKPYKDGLAIESTSLSTSQVYNNGAIENLQGKGIGTEIYKYAIQKTLSQNKPFYSDQAQTASANGVWEKLKSLKIVKQEEGRNKIESTPSSHFDNNGEVLPQVLFTYLRGEQNKGAVLTFEQKQDIKNALLTLPFADSQEMADALEKAFYNNEGEFKVEDSKLREIYSDYEILNIKTDLELQKNIKNIIKALKNIDEVFTKESYSESDFLAKQFTINSLGKLVNNNPLLTEKKVIEELGGVPDREEFLSKAEALEIPKVLELAKEENNFEFKGIETTNKIQEVSTNEFKSSIEEKLIPFIRQDNKNSNIIDLLTKVIPEKFLIRYKEFYEVAAKNGIAINVARNSVPYGYTAGWQFGSVNIDPLVIKNNIDNYEGFVEVINHEVIHGLLSRGIKDNYGLYSSLLNVFEEVKKNKESASKNVQDIIDYIESTSLDFKEKDILNATDEELYSDNFREVGSLEELITYAFTNTEFAEFLSNISMTTATDNTKTTIFNRLKDIIKNYLKSLTTDYNALEEINNILNNFFNLDWNQKNFLERNEQYEWGETLEIVLKEESKTLFQKMQEFKRIPEMKVEGNTLTPVVDNNTTVQLEQTLKLSDDLSISSDIIYLNELAQDLYNENIEDVKQLIKEIEVKAAKQGVDIAGLSSKVFSKTRDEIYDLLESLNTLLLDPSEQSFNEFILEHQSVFDLEVKPSVKVEVVSENNLNKSLVYLKTNLSEYSLFNDFGLLKVSEDIYQRVEKEDLETLYNKLYDISQYNQNILPLEAFPLANQEGIISTEVLQNAENRDLIVADIKRFIENEVSKLDIPTVSLDNTVLQQMVINKYAFGHPITFKKNVDFQEEFNSFEAFDGNEEYLKTDFIADFYSEFLQEKIKDSEKYKEFYSNFSINERGVILVNDDAITVQKIKDYLAEKNIKQAKDLENYSLLTDQIPNLKTLEKPSSDYTRDFYRANYSNNPMSLDKVKGEYKFITDTTIVKNNSVDNFIRVKDRVFELVDTKGGNSFYEEIPVNTSEYKTFNLPQPVLSVNIDNYGAERLDEIPPVKTEKYYSKAEEQKINSENFECL